MKLREVLGKIHDYRLTQAVYDELVAHLERAVMGEIEIPSPTEEGLVPPMAIQIVLEELAETRDRYVEMIESAEEMEVVDVRGEGPHPDGPQN
jgi:hypothetical protein